MAMRKLSDELGLKFEDVKMMHGQYSRKGINEPTTIQLKHATNTVEEDYHAILFLYKKDRKKYGKLIEQMENDILHRKDPFPKTNADACRILAGSKNKYDNKDPRITEANDGMAFATIGRAIKRNK